MVEIVVLLFRIHFSCLVFHSCFLQFFDTLFAWNSTGFPRIPCFFFSSGEMAWRNYISEGNVLLRLGVGKKGTDWRWREVSVLCSCQKEPVERRIWNWFWEPEKGDNVLRLIDLFLIDSCRLWLTFHRGAVGFDMPPTGRGRLQQVREGIYLA